MHTAKKWDDIVIGAGSAGAIIASRLSEQQDREVLLLEAGPDFADTRSIPQELKDARCAVTTGYNWDLTASIQHHGGARQILDSARVLAAAPARHALAVAAVAVRSSTALQEQPYFPGKVVGGTSAVNGAIALRGHPSDFAKWAQAGNSEWTWDQVLPTYVGLESDSDFEGATHGQSGPVPISRPQTGDLHPLQAAFRDACRAIHLHYLPDLNESAAQGVGPAPSNSVNHVRMSTAMTHLAVARHRANLTIKSGVLTDRIVFEGKRAVGVDVIVDGKHQRLEAARITLSAGTFGTPAILTRSGVASADTCEALGVRVVADLPGVGDNLIEHPAVMLWMIPRPGLCREGEPYHQMLARFSSAQSGECDTYLFMLSSLVTRKMPLLGDLLHAPLASAISVMLASPRARGRVELSTRNPLDKPSIQLGLGAAPEDIERLMAGVRLAWRIARSQQLSQCTQSIFMWNDNIIESDAMLQRAVKRMINGSWHAAGTAKMGPESDPAAVVDQHCRVRGVEGLRVVDASVFPFIPSVPTGLTCMMVAERVANWMRTEEN